MTDETQPTGVWRLPESLGEDLDAFAKKVAQFQRGEISAMQLRAFRVPQGVYEQRQSGMFMLRVRLPAGMMLPHQMRVLADVSREHGNGVLHVTSRQDIQVHSVPLESIHPALVELAGAGLSTKGGGGNTVRNITACSHAGVCPNEAFDVTPDAVVLTEMLLRDPMSFQLPRKYKIAFSGCGNDCAGATVNDLGLIAKRRNGSLGYTVYAAGGMGGRSRVADLLEEFVPACDVPLVAEAIKRVFDKHGNRKNKHEARLRFVARKIGAEALADLYRKELEALRASPPDCPDRRELPSPSPAELPADAAAQPPADGFDAWRQNNVTPQRQEGHFIAEIHLPLGDVDADALRRAADVVGARGERMLRTTQQQNTVIRWVREDELAALHAKLAALGLADSLPGVLRHMVACAGASTCRLGICLSRGLANAIERAAARSDVDLRAVGDVGVHISGCSNACGRHPIGQIALSGAARRVGGRLVPHYMLQLGGRAEEGKTELASGQQAVPARNVPAVVTELLGAFAASDQCPDFAAFLDAGGRGTAEQIAARYADVPEFDEDKNFYFDWGADEVFSMAGRGPGECSAGVFDLIEVDLKSAAESLQEGRLFSAAALAARALLVTQGNQPADDADAFGLFQKNFVQAGIIDAAHEPVIAAGLRSASSADPAAAFDADSDDVAALVTAVQELYEGMDDSLRFPAASEAAPPDQPPAAESAELAAEGAPEPAATDVAKDFRGVACPLNYVKTKLALEQMAAGQTLSVLLDEEGARNVPASAADDGHEVLATDQQGDHWRVVLRKGP